MEHTSISPEEAADRLAIRELIDAYAHCADRREAEGQKSLFTEDTHFLVYMNGFGTDPSEDLRGRQALTRVFEALKQYEVTMHFNGQCTIKLADPGATAETYCVAHHVFSKDGERQIFTAYLRYEDELTKEQGNWLFSSRKLYVEITDSRPLGG